MTRVRKNIERFTEAAIDDEIVLMRIDTGEFYSLSGSGAEVWRLIDDQRSEADIVKMLEASFTAPTAVIAKDVTELIRELAGMGLVDRA
jgi:4-diphosphocytidyl-2C-methyl-D-erythritol kinase